MSIDEWSDDIYVVDMADDPKFTDILTTLLVRLEKDTRDVVVNFSAVGMMNSSNIAQLLRLRKVMISHSRKLVLCNANYQIQGIFSVTGLDTLFQFTEDISVALAMLQVGGD